MIFLFFFFNDTATTEIYTLSLHDALPISEDSGPVFLWDEEFSGMVEHDVRVPAGDEPDRLRFVYGINLVDIVTQHLRSEEHTSELQSQSNLVCRLLLEKKKKTLNY